jgi:hypothetical protein
MRAKAWRGGVLGIRVGKANAIKFFDKNSPIAEVDIDGTYFPFALSETFWTTCPEIRGASIGQWLRTRGLDVWLYRHPPEVELIPLGKNRFKLSDECLPY